MNLLRDPSPDLDGLAELINDQEIAGPQFLKVNAVDADPASQNAFLFLPNDPVAGRLPVRILALDAALTPAEFIDNQMALGLDPICQEPVNLQSGTLVIVVFREQAVPAPAPGTPPIPQQAYDLILNFEGLDQPYLFPGFDSGISLGRGYDLGAEKSSELFHDWGGLLTQDQLNRLSAAVGKSGRAAQALCATYRDIHVTSAMADQVFYAATVPKYYAQTLGAFPGLQKLPPLAQGALLSLVFNRGPGMKDWPPPAPGTLGRRAEMREIRDAVPNGDLAAIATALDSMKRLWPNQGPNSLYARRVAEAAMVRSAIV